MNYNVPGGELSCSLSVICELTNIGKLNRGLSVCDTAEILKGSELTQDEYFKAAILGWSVELVSYCFREEMQELMDSFKPVS